MPASNILTLRQTCRRFRAAYQPSEFDTPALIFKTNDDQLEFLAMLLRDSPSTNLLICPVCLRLHPPARYSEAELLKPLPQRQCLYRSKLMLCPHSYLLFYQWKEFIANGVEGKREHFKGCGQCCLSLPSTTGDPKSPRRAPTQRVGVKLQLLNAYLRRADLKRNLTKALRGRLDMPICAHLRFSDEEFTQRYVPDSLGLREYLGPFKAAGQARWCIWPWHGWVRKVPKRDRGDAQSAVVGRSSGSNFKREVVSPSKARVCSGLWCVCRATDGDGDTRYRQGLVGSCCYGGGAEIHLGRLEHV